MKDTTMTQPPQSQGPNYPEHNQPSDPSQSGMPGSPGVYVRTGDYRPQELDLLWSGSKHYPREERSPWLFAVVGLAAGIIITAVVFTLFTSKPEIKAGKNDFLEPVVTEAELAPANTLTDAQPTPQPTSTKPAQTASNTTTPATTTSTKTSQATTKTATKGKVGPAHSYVVKNGDTLEMIARRYYGSGAPQWIQKIQRANNMSNPNRLSLGQKLIIPPKNY